MTPDPETTKKEKEIFEYLKNLYDPIAIVLTGSRVTGNISSHSDWDIYVFTNQEFKSGLNEHAGELLDITLIKYPTPTDFILDTKYHPEQHLKIIYDLSGGWINEIVERTKDKYTKGPSDIPAVEYERLKKIMRRYIQKVLGRRETKGLAFYYLGIFYEISLRLWFQIRNEWPLPPYEALPHIQKSDPKFFELLEEIQDSNNTNGQIVAAEGIYKKLFV